MNAFIFVFGVFFLGMFVGYLVRVFITRHSGYSGVILVTKTPEKTIYSLELSGPPEDIENEKEVLFKVSIHPTVGVSQSNHGI